MDDFKVLDSIFKDPTVKHKLDLFTKEELSKLKLSEKDGKYYVYCPISKKDRVAKPEEIIRQLYIQKLLFYYNYPLERLEVEWDVWFGSGVSEKRADIVVLHKDLESPYIIVEVKKPKRRDGERQLKSYCNAEGSPIGVWTNGRDIIILHREEPNIFAKIDDIPSASQTLNDVIKEKKTIDDLTGRFQLRDIILSLEDMVLANAGVDAFEEVFKLIYAKLYDEWEARRRGDRSVNFRITGESPQELYDKINNLFLKSTKQWKGVFKPFDKIELRATHLVTCVSYLQNIRLFNSNLQIIDEAFEYLITQVSKGEKGQYFTPRFVIDMAVKMLNPKYNEYLIDTAAGSCGFTVHSIFWVWGEQITGKPPTPENREYAQEKVFAIDFDDRAVKVAKAINLIAGDGKSHVYKLNSLDPTGWDDEGRAALRPFLRRFPDNPKLDEDNQKNFGFFDFNILMTNPPFAGDIRERSILRNYRLAEDCKGKLRNKVGRDIIFIERNLNFLKPGGRMAIVLPQGRLNNISDENIRNYIMSQARILGVVSLHKNTFKPHSGTKTSVLFLQKWDEKLCPYKEDYPIFFAISKKPGKDNSGDYVFRKNPDGSPIVDEHDHFVYHHDLDEIADAFIEFAKREGFSFWRES